MANLFFPQLSSGAVAQYPIRKTRIARTVRNVLPDGTLVLFPDPNAAQIAWQLGYTGLCSDDLNTLTDHFSACEGRLHAFTFIDPTDNMLTSSATLAGPAWQVPSMVQITTGITDPRGGSTALCITNNGQVSQQISQTVTVPAAYQYCFSVYMQSAQPAAIILIRSGPASQQTTSIQVGAQWARAVSSGKLTDPGTALTVGVSLSPGQQIFLYGPQLEAQVVPSRYRPTLQTGGIYPNAHWGVDELPVSADAPNLFSTAFSIESSI
jgi:hypothetical protein